MLATRLQPTNRSRVIQLKNELHNIQMKDSSMTQYLAQVKTLVDNIAAAGSHVDTEDILMYILNGLPASYNFFKSSVRTSLLPISLETLYSLLCSEEINIQNELRKDTPPATDNLAFYSSRGRNNRGRMNTRGRGMTSRQQSNAGRPQATTPNTRPVCQICAKNGHTAVTCWYRYSSSSSEPSRALLSQNQSSNTSEWILDSAASSFIFHTQTERKCTLGFLRGKTRKREKNHGATPS
ncbi:Retrovirus-related Pol polyprotein from transposon TNT 1-94 [Dendrobium catenatum]|uniref:Retrovirus-related Pol polyprotein from transposon TNT 1-94 n=1 Tax=Dendrobium catenatum TaxID=906689 RepID=A0A2I0WC81_9ASPA|nr:Retrovirus-related Pol polyprotein from transposon TNT 1-94 [Dendrobium catenatum]